MNKRLSEDILFGEWVRQRRHILDLTQQELADQVGCARITLRRIEAGTLKPSKELAQILLEKLGAPSTQGEEWLRFARGLSGFPRLSVDTSTSKPITNLPTALTSFVGREKEQEDVVQLIAKNRLITIAGVGGIGKTRLAQQVGPKLLNEYPDGVWFIALDSLSDPALVASTVAATFDIRDGSSDQPLIERLIYSLRKKTVLLILDNCEHLLDACAQLITTLLSNCPNLKVLVTSREILNMEGEVIYDLQTLSLPEDRFSLETITKYEAIQLFIERAALTLSSFRLKNENAQIIVNICRRVDGIPLAIEMAAARVDILSVDEILRQLNHCFGLLVGKSRSALPRHQTMRASMDWDWGLLTETERKFM
ncbi:MAG TPA: NB-ARC domain-containing protein, partial [Anaerolineales bacterium]|nr:NB-ARC domain-containing protein [Anaerolineales bacterium]